MKRLTPLFKASSFFSVTLTAFMALMFFVILKQDINTTTLVLLLLINPIIAFGGYYLAMGNYLKNANK